MITKKGTLNYRVTQRMLTNYWLQDESSQIEIGLHNVANPHQVFEGVFVNVSASIGRSWREVYNAKEHQTELYSALCVSGVLIDKWLEKRFRLSETDRIHLLGARLSEIVYKYKNTFGLND